MADGEGFLSDDGMELYTELVAYGWTPQKAYNFAYSFDMGEIPVEVVDDTLSQLMQERKQAETEAFIEEQKLHPTEVKKEISQEVKDFNETHFPSIMPSLRNELNNSIQGFVDEKILETKQTTGRDTSVEGILSALTPEEISGLEEGGIKGWLNTPQGQNAIPLLNAWGQLSKAAYLTGMTPGEYLFSSYSDYISNFHPDYIAERGENQLMQDFMGFDSPGGDSIIDHIGNDITTATEAVGHEVETTRGKLTPKYEMTTEGERQLSAQQPLPQATPPPTYQGKDVSGFRYGQYTTTDPTTGETVTLPFAETPAVTEAVKGQIQGGVQEGGTGAYGGGGGGRPDITITQAQARAAYIEELKRREYGPDDVAYLSQFFNTLLPGPYPKKVPAGEEFLESLKGFILPSPPRREQKKTRFIGGIR